MRLQLTWLFPSTVDVLLPPEMMSNCGRHSSGGYHLKAKIKLILAPQNEFWKVPNQTRSDMKECVYTCTCIYLTIYMRVVKCMWPCVNTHVQVESAWLFNNQPSCNSLEHSLVKAHWHLFKFQHKSIWTHMHTWLSTNWTLSFENLSLHKILNLSRIREFYNPGTSGISKINLWFSIKNASYLYSIERKMSDAGLLWST